MRIAHLGLGAFHRSHQAWFTQHANDTAAPGDAWGIRAFTGRSRRAADLLAPSQGVYTLLERSAEGDRAETVQALVEATDGGDHEAWEATLTDPAVSVLTVTVTEGGYAPTATAPRRIAAGLLARAAAGDAPIAVVSCDNLPRNGRVLRDAVCAAAGPEARRIDEIGSFVDTVVDRITPAVTAHDLSAVRELTGHDDPAAVVAEPFAEWVLRGEFPGGRPAWDRVGARVVDDIAPYEERKLWLLNAGHSFLAAAGSLRGFETIAQAFDDQQLRAEVEALWDAQREQIALDTTEVDGWLDDLRSRFANPRIAHRLEQIRGNSPLKVAVRLIAPIRQRGTPAAAQTHAVETWIRSVLDLEPTDEPTRLLARALHAVPPSDRTRAVIDYLTPEGKLA